MKDILKFTDYSSGLNVSPERISGIGTKRAQLLEKIGIYSLGDALFHFPRRYEDRRRIKGIDEILPGRVEVVKGTIGQIKSLKAGNTYIIKASLEDGVSSLEAVWFNQRHLLRILKPGREIVVVGKVKEHFGKREILVQEFEEPFKEQISGRILPFYPSTSGLPQRIFRNMAEEALKNVESVPDRLPGYFRKKYDLPEISQALEGIHRPEDFDQLDKARRRFIFEELFLHQYYINRLAQSDKSCLGGISHSESNTLGEAFIDSLGFDLTADQMRAVGEIEEDMGKPFPMNRLLQGEVGSGKTLVAIQAMLKAISNGFQAAFMAPTEILAEQHYLYLLDSLKSIEVNVGLVTGNVTGLARKKILEDVEEGAIDILVGTQALIQGQVRFHKLGLVVIDEQHRFGVVQRRRLTEFTPPPDVLVMTATPIPRSLELTFYGDLDLSVIRRLPPGRKKIFTRYVAEKERYKLYKFMRGSLAAGRQAYVVCPLIEESESLEISAAEDIFEKLRTKVFPDCCVGLLHGKLKSSQKERIMADFKDKKIHVLVSTTVIEVGIDVPNAGIIVIEGSERFGLAQLHQLRGRVGRGPYQSYCFLLGNLSTREAKERIKAMISSSSGFDIAEKDLEIRGPGDLLGTKQHGLPAFQVADPVRDLHWAVSINKEIKKLATDGFPGTEEEQRLLEICCRDTLSALSSN